MASANRPSAVEEATVTFAESPNATELVAFAAIVAFVPKAILLAAEFPTLAP